MKSIAGHFLIASPHLHDENFLRTVVLMIDHNRDGAFGIVLTRPLNRTLRDIWQMIGSPECPVNDPLFLGGPVSSPLLALHAHPELSEMKVPIIPGVYLSAHKDQLQALVASCAQPLRIFTGYSGWGAGQLDGELKAGGWLVTPATAASVFAPYETLWDEAMAQVGGEVLKDILPTGHGPTDPLLN